MKNMDEMHDATVSMNDKMDGTNASVQKTNLYVASTYFDLRQGNAKSNRYNALQEMERASSPEAKIAAAGVYFMGFEFQLWKGMGQDSESRLDGLYDEAMKELFRTIQNYKSAERPIDIASTDSRLQNLEALAVTLHFVNPNSVQASKTGKAVSVLSLIEGTLEAREEIWARDADSRSRIPEYQKEILDHLEDAVYLLQLRGNYLGAMVLAKISDIQKTGMSGLYTKAGMFLATWEPKLERLNPTQLDTYKVWMEESLRVRAELQALGFQPSMDPTMMKVYRNIEMRVARADAVKGSSEKVARDEATRSKAAAELLAKIEAFRR